MTFYIDKINLKKFLKYIFGNEIKIIIYCHKNKEEITFQVLLKEILNDIINKICKKQKGIIVEDRQTFFEFLWEVIQQTCLEAISMKGKLSHYEFLYLRGKLFDMLEQVQEFPEEVLEDLFWKALSKKVINIITRTI